MNRPPLAEAKRITQGQINAAGADYFTHAEAAMTLALLTLATLTTGH